MLEVSPVQLAAWASLVCVIPPPPLGPAPGVSGEEGRLQLTQKADGQQVRIYWGGGDVMYSEHLNRADVVTAV